MNNLEDKLKQAHIEMLRSNQINKMLEDLFIQKDSIIEQINILRKNMFKEQRDVERLEKLSFSSLLSSFLGNREAELTKEQEEALNAKLKYDSATKELERINEDIRMFKIEAETLKGCNVHYEELLIEKTNQIKLSNPVVAEEIIQLENRVLAKENELKELREAISWGNKALNSIGDVLKRLDSANNYATWDVIGGGSLTTYIKHVELDEAQAGIADVRCYLGRFKTELADGNINAEIQVNLDSFTKFADYFFDSLYMDITVKNQIKDSINYVKQTKQQVESMLFKLKTMLERTQAEMFDIKHQLEQLIKKTSC